MSDQQLIAYLGPRGTYSEEMALKFYSHRPADLIPHSSLYGALQAVENSEAAEAIIPIENSLEGAVSVVVGSVRVSKKDSIRLRRSKTSCLKGTASSSVC